MASAVSVSGMPNSKIGTSMAIAPGEIVAAWMDKHDTMKPRVRLPESPIKIDAGLML